MGEYEYANGGGAAAAIVDDAWMDVISSQGSSLLHLDLSASDVTDHGLTFLGHCTNIISLNLNHCHQISDHGLECISGWYSFQYIIHLAYIMNSAKCC